MVSEGRPVRGAVPNRRASMVAIRRGDVLGKIAVDLERAVATRRATGVPGSARAATLAVGEGWSAHDVICTSGPGDRTFEERHEDVSVSLVVAGTFHYRSALGGGMMTPGSVLLGNPGTCYECGHEHADGDRCIAFHFASDFFERLAAEIGARRGERFFRIGRLPPLRAMTPVLAMVAAGLAVPDDAAWEELAIGVATAALRAGARLPDDVRGAPPGAVARVTRSVRDIDRAPAERWSLAQLARDAGQSPYHFLRTFRAITGTTPHRYVSRARLRRAAARLVAGEARIAEVALDAGFADLSAFNRAFRLELGAAPTAFRTAARRRFASPLPADPAESRT